MEIIFGIYRILPLVLLIVTIPYFILTFLGFFLRKIYPKTEEFLRYAVIIPARNESMVIKDSVESIKAAECGDKIDVYVLAHNCTDDTLIQAENAGAIGFVYNNSTEKTKGFAIKAFIQDCIEKNKLENYDGFFIVDADNLVKKDFFIKMNEAFVSEGKKSVINGYQNAKNFGENIISSLYGIYQLRNASLERRSRSVLNISSRIRGTSYLIPAKILRNGFPYTSLTEDWDFCGDLILKGVNIAYCEQAEFFDEQPTSFRVMLRQRYRWSAGYLFVSRKYFFQLLKALLLPRKADGSAKKLSVYDFMISLIPYPTLIVFNDCLLFITAAIGIGFGVDFHKVIMHWLGILQHEYLSLFLIEYALTISCFILERKHITGVSLKMKAITVLLYPFFFLLSFPIQIAAFFSKDVRWETIPHTSAERPDLSQ